MNLKINKAMISDIDELIFCNKRNLPIYYKSEDYINFIKNDNFITLIARIDNKIIGYIIGEYSFQKNLFHILSFAVDQDFRRKNIGSILMNRIINYAKYKFINLNYSSLNVSEHNYKAIKFYETNGFKLIKIIKNYYSSNDNGFYYLKKIR